MFSVITFLEFQRIYKRDFFQHSLQTSASKMNMKLLSW